MLQVRVNGQPLVLRKGTKVSLVINNSLFDEEVLSGTFSYLFTIPLNENRATFGYPELIENVADLRREFTGAEVEDAGYLGSVYNQSHVSAAIKQQVAK